MKILTTPCWWFGTGKVFYKIDIITDDLELEKFVTKMAYLRWFGTVMGWRNNYDNNMFSMPF